MLMLPLVVKLILLCVYSSVWCNEATINIPKNGSLPPAVLAFGDSLLDSGNNNFRKTIVKADFPPYGKDFMGGKPTGWFNNRKNLADYTGKLKIRMRIIHGSGSCYAPFESLLYLHVI